MEKLQTFVNWFISFKKGDQRLIAGMTVIILVLSYLVVFLYKENKSDREKSQKQINQLIIEKSQDKIDFLDFKYRELDKLDKKREANEIRLDSIRNAFVEKFGK